MMATLRICLGSCIRWSPARVGAQSSPTRGACVGPVVRAAALCCLAVGPAASAQDAPWAATGAPGGSFSLQDDATSLAGNPGGLGFASGLEVDFLHKGLYAKDSDCPSPTRCFRDLNGHAEALFLTAGTGPLALGLGFDWLDREGFSTQSGTMAPAGFSARRTSLGAALRFGSLGVGAVHRGYASGSSALLDGVSAWDFGVLARPNSWLSVGAAALDANEPSINSGIPGASLPRRWRLSIGLRPTQTVEGALDTHWREGEFDRKDFIFTVNAQVVRGLRAIAQFTVHTNPGGRSGEGIVGLQLDLAHLGFTYAPHFAEDAPIQADWRIRLSSERWPALRFPRPRAALIDLAKALARPKPRALGAVFRPREPRPARRDAVGLPPARRRHERQGGRPACERPAHRNGESRRTPRGYRGNAVEGQEGRFLSGNRWQPRI